MHHHLSAFHWDTDVGVYLFPGLKVNGSTALFLLSLVLILLSIAYEAIKVSEVDGVHMHHSENSSKNRYYVLQVLTLKTRETLRRGSDVHLIIF